MSHNNTTILLLIVYSENHFSAFLNLTLVTIWFVGFPVVKRNSCYSYRIRLNHTVVFPGGSCVSIRSHVYYFK